MLEQEILPTLRTLYSGDGDFSLAGFCGLLCDPIKWYCGLPDQSACGHSHNPGRIHCRLLAHAGVSRVSVDTYTAVGRSEVATSTIKLIIASKSVHQNIHDRDAEPSERLNHFYRVMDNRLHILIIYG